MERRSRQRIAAYHGWAALGTGNLRDVGLYKDVHNVTDEAHAVGDGVVFRAAFCSKLCANERHKRRPHDAKRVVGKGEADCALWWLRDREEGEECARVCRIALHLE